MSSTTVFISPSQENQLPAPSSAEEGEVTASPELSESSLESLSSSWWAQLPAAEWWRPPGHSSGARRAEVCVQGAAEVRCRCSSVQLRLCTCGMLALRSRGASTLGEKRGDGEPRALPSHTVPVLRGQSHPG